MRSLSGRAHSIGEMRVKLRAKAERSEDVEGILGRLKDYGYLDDKRFAATFAAARLENQGLGKSRVMSELMRRRVAAAVADTAVEAAYSSTDEFALIEDYIRRKYRTADRETLFQSQKDLASAYHRLQRAGFAPRNIVTVLKKFAKNPELLDTLNGDVE